MYALYTMPISYNLNAFRLINYSCIVLFSPTTLGTFISTKIENSLQSITITLLPFKVNVL
jgi:hypothetical protein